MIILQTIRSEMYYYVYYISEKNFNLINSGGRLKVIKSRVKIKAKIICSRLFIIFLSCLNVVIYVSNAESINLFYALFEYFAR